MAVRHIQLLAHACCMLGSTQSQNQSVNKLIDIFLQLIFIFMLKIAKSGPCPLLKYELKFVFLVLKLCIYQGFQCTKSLPVMEHIIKIYVNICLVCSLMSLDIRGGERVIE